MSSLESCTNALLQQRAVQSSNHDNLERHILDLQRTRRAACLKLHLLIEDVARRARDLHELQEHNAQHLSELQQSRLKLAALQLVTRESRSRRDQVTASLTHCEQSWNDSTPTHWAAVLSALQQRSACVQACPAFVDTLQQLIATWDVRHRAYTLHRRVTLYESRYAACRENFAQQCLPQRASAQDKLHVALQSRQAELSTKQASLSVARCCAEQEVCALSAVCAKTESLVCTWQALDQVARSQLALATHAVTQLARDERASCEALWRATLWRKMCVDVVRCECRHRQRAVATARQERRAMLRAMIDTVSKLHRTICDTVHPTEKLFMHGPDNCTDGQGNTKHETIVLRAEADTSDLTEHATTTIRTTTTTTTTTIRTTTTEAADSMDSSESMPTKITAATAEAEAEEQSITAAVHPPDVLHCDEEAAAAIPCLTEVAMSVQLADCRTRVRALHRLRSLAQVLRRVLWAAMGERRARWLRERRDRARRVAACRWWREETDRLCSRRRDAEEATQAEEMLTRRSLCAAFAQTRQQLQQLPKASPPPQSQQQHQQQEWLQSRHKEHHERRIDLKPIQPHEHEQSRLQSSADATVNQTARSSAMEVTKTQTTTPKASAAVPKTALRIAAPGTQQHTPMQSSSHQTSLPQTTHAPRPRRRYTHQKGAAAAADENDVEAAVPASYVCGEAEEAVLSPAAHSLSHARVRQTRTEQPATRKRRMKNPAHWAARARAVHTSRQVKQGNVVTRAGYDEGEFVPHDTRAAVGSGAEGELHDIPLCQPSEEHRTRRMTLNAQESATTSATATRKCHPTSHCTSGAQGATFTCDAADAADLSADIPAAAGTASRTTATAVPRRTQEHDDCVHKFADFPTHTASPVEHAGQSGAVVILSRTSSATARRTQTRAAHAATAGRTAPLSRHARSRSPSVAHTVVHKSFSHTHSSPSSPSSCFSSFVAASSSPSVIVASSAAPLRCQRRSPPPRCPRWLPRRRGGGVLGRSVTAAVRTTATTAAEAAAATTTTAAATAATTRVDEDGGKDSRNTNRCRQARKPIVWPVPCAQSRRAAPKSKLRRDELWCGVSPATAVRPTLPRRCLNVTAGEDIFADIFS